MSKLNYVNIDDLKVGDTVGLCRFVLYGWNRHFRYPIIYKRVIKRITPKRTKFVLDDDTELDIINAKGLVLLDDEAERQSSLAQTYYDLQHINYKIGEAKRQKSVYIIENKLNDEELIEYHKLMRTLYDKYFGGQE